MWGKERNNIPNGRNEDVTVLVKLMNTLAGF